MPEDLPSRVFIPLTFVVPNCEVTVSVLSSYQIDHVTYLLTYYILTHFVVYLDFNFQYLSNFAAVRFLADRTNGRAYATVLRLSVCLSVVCLSVTLCIVAKRCVIEQKLLLRAYRKSYVRNRLVPK